MRSKLFAVLTFAFAAAWPAEAADSGGSAFQGADRSPQAFRPLIVAAVTTQKKILADFIDAISRQEYDTAFSMLHPRMSAAWTGEGFARDWAAVRRQLSGGWQPKLTGTFTGRSTNGPYEQVSYRLVSDWRSLASVDLTAMTIEGESRIVQVHVRTPIKGAPSHDVEVLIEDFVAAMLREDYSAVQTMFAPERRPQFPPAMLARIRPILGDSQQSANKRYYRLNANTVWYDAVRLTSPNDPATYLDVITEAGSDRGQIITLSFKGRLRQ